MGVAIVAAVAVGGPRAALAQLGAGSEVRPGDGLLGRFGVAAAASGLRDDDPDGRRRAVARLAQLGTKEAIAEIVDALEPGVLRGEARVEAIRALAAHVADDDVRSALSREVLQAGGARRDGGRGASEPARMTAALALARSRDPRATSALGAALREGGAAAAAAREALLAHPPPALEPILGKASARDRARIDGRTLSAELVSFFGELGDARAIPPLRAALGASSPLVRAEAARALASLGDAAALTYAAQAAERDPRLRTVRAEVLARFADPRAALDVIALLGDAATRRAALVLVRRAPDARYVAPLVKLLPSTPELADDLIAAIGACGTSEGAAALVERTSDRERAPSAAVALGRSPGEAARAAVAKLLAESTDPAAVRAEAAAVAGIVRALALGDVVPGLASHLDRLAKSASPSASELGAFGLVALGDRSVTALLGAKPSSVSEERWWGALARGALASGPDARAELSRAYLARRGTSPLGGPLETAAAVGLLDAATAETWPTSTLLDLVRRGSAPSPLAARELARRDDGSLRADLDALLAGSDPLVRAYVVAGLAPVAQPDATARLVAATDDEDPTVRRAAVRGLSWRTGPRARRVLETLATLDPDAGVRALARLAWAGRKVVPPSTGGDVGLLVVADVESAARRTWTARVTRPDGVLVPVVVPTGGWLVVPGIGAGPSSVLLVEPASPPLAEKPAVKKPVAP